MELIKSIDGLLDDDFFCGFEFNLNGAMVALGLGWRHGGIGSWLRSREGTPAGQTAVDDI